MKTFLIVLIKMYQKTLSPHSGVFGTLHNSPIFNLNPGLRAGCRLKPSCSEYCIDSINKLGVWRGLKLSLFRLIRCR